MTWAGRLIAENAPGLGISLFLDFGIECQQLQDTGINLRLTPRQM